jgi:hypothetical protein
MLVNDTQVNLNKNLVLFDLLYGCEPLALKKDDRLVTSENIVLMRMFGTKRDEATGSWRKFRSEIVRNFHSSPNIVKIFKSQRVRWVGNKTRMEK